MWIALYKTLMQSSTPVLEAYLGRRLRLGKEDPVRFRERRGEASKIREQGPLVWFHAASVGESQSLLVLIRRMLADYPGLQVLVTTGTVTSAKLMSERLPAGAFHQYMPVDHPAWTERFLDHWHPDLVIWAESELWPNMLLGVQKRGIPAVLLNARMSEKSFRRWKLARADIGKLLGVFRFCLGQNAAEVRRLQQLGAGDARVSGNLKYAAAPLPYDVSELEKLKVAIGSRPHLLWASTHPGEEEAALRLHHALKSEFPQLLTIIVPRHPPRGPEVAALCKGAALRSGGALPSDGKDFYIADTLGELGLFYRLSRLCIVGGSFVPVGGHNPIEPAQLGCQIFYGPYMFNFVSICQDFESRHGVLPLKDEDMLCEKSALALRDPARFSAMAEAARHWTGQQAHVVDEIMAALAPALEKITTPRKAGAA